MAALHYILNSLPALGDWGSIPPVTPAGMFDYVEDDSLKTLLETVFLGDDLLQYQSYLTGGMTNPLPVVLSESQVRNETPLPEYLVSQASELSVKIPADTLLAGYYRYADHVAHSLKSSFLVDWLAYEVALRNALAADRARVLNISPDDYLVVTELADSQIDFTALLNEWTASSTPLGGLRILDQNRWQWLQGNDSWFTFHHDEFLAYAAKLMLLRRWNRLEGSAENENTVD